jgi:hypothetical protein
MNIVLLNWKYGENDPFTYINHELKLRLEDYGCHVDILEIDANLAQNLLLIDNQKKIHAVITHQGLASDTRLLSNDRLVWEELKLNLICLHSDHPSHAPANHHADSKYVAHTYCLPDFARFSNSMKRRENPAFFLGMPNFYKTRFTALRRAGDFFVFPKNIDSTHDTYLQWEKSCPEYLYKILRNLSDAIIDNYRNGDILEHHDLIDQLVTPEQLEPIKRTSPDLTDKTILLFLHNQLDKIYRNAASELVLEELSDVPLKINGRGWDSFATKASKYHHFSTFDKVIQGDEQFYSNYGIIDIVPHKHSLHDRTLRAVAHQGGFLSNSKLAFEDAIGRPFSSLFYTGTQGDLRSKAQAVMDDPLSHLDRCRQFGLEIERAQPFDRFLNFIYMRFLATLD